MSNANVMLEKDGPTDTDLAWAAGFVDGEGCITAVNQTYKPKNGKPRRPTLRFRLSVSQNCHSTLSRLQGILGEKSYLNEVPMRESHNRRMYQLQLDGRNALNALRKIEGYMHRKKQSVTFAEKLFSEGKLGKNPGRKGLDEETLKARSHWADRLRKAH